MDDHTSPEPARDELSPRDVYTQPATYAPPTPARPVAGPPRLSRLMWVLAFLLLLLVAPPLIQRLQYANTYAKERARVDVALEGLGELELGALSTASRLVAQVAGPSVVNIRTIQLIDGRPTSGDEWSFLLPQQRAAQGQGSGVIVDEQGFIVTNSHVVADATRIIVLLPDGRQVPARVQGSDPLTDIAVLKIEADNLIPAKWGDSDLLEVGDMVWAVGSPYGLERSVTFGILSAKGRRGVTQSLYQDFLQTDAAVNPGNSGGPLVNLKGEVIGINTAIVGPAYQGISFAIPSSIALDVYDRLRKTGRVARGWLGVELRALTPEIAKRLDLEDVEGVLVAGVVRDSPAMQAGIEAGDVIVRWNNLATPDPTTLSRLVAGTEIGSTAEVVVRRGGEELELEVRISERPE